MQFPIVLAALAPGVFTILIGLYRAIREVARRDWPSTPGIVVRSESQKGTAFYISGVPQYYYSNQITYEYTVGDRQYTSVKERGRRDDSRGLGSTSVEVFYHPRFPENSTLNKGISRITLMLILGGLLIIITSAIWLDNLQASYSHYLR